MKKLLVLALAAMMAFGVTAMVGAKMPDQEQIPVYVKVNPFAQLITDDESLYITLEECQWPLQNPHSWPPKMRPASPTSSVPLS